MQFPNYICHENDYLGVLYSYMLSLIFISNKSVKLRRIINGKTVVLLSDGELYKDNFKRARLDI